MEALLTVFGNSTREDNYEEMNLWYGWVHIRDVLTMKAALAVQRFELSEYQPKNADTSHKVLACYEIPDVFYSNAAHLQRTANWKMRISNAFAKDFAEAYWTPIFKTADWADYADYKGDKGIFSCKLQAKTNTTVEEYFTLDVLNELAKLPGFEAVHLFRWDPEIQMPKFAVPEKLDHHLMGQISNCYAAANEWDRFVETHPEVTELFELAPVVFKPMMDRIRDVDLFKCAEWRALQELAHLIQDDKEDRRGKYLSEMGMDISALGLPEEYLQAEDKEVNLFKLFNK